MTRLACALGLVAALAGCRPEAPPAGPEATCARACQAGAARCSAAECARGCGFVLDRLAEGEGGRVLACVAARTGACDDRAWARCATRIGPHADGGPPPPAPPPGVFEGED